MKAAKAMKRAHEIRRNAAKRFNCKVSEILFNICLEMAWKEIKERKIMTLTEMLEKLSNKVKNGKTSATIIASHTTGK